MTNEDRMLSMLEQIMEKVDGNSQKLDEHGKKLDAHGRMLSEHGKKLDEHSKKLDEHERILHAHGEILNTHTMKLDEHGQILRALQSGQEHIKAEVDGIKVSHANEFGEIKKQMADYAVNFEILRDDAWENKKDIRRIKKTMGMG